MQGLHIKTTFFPPSKPASFPHWFPMLRKGTRWAGWEPRESRPCFLPHRSLALPPPPGGFSITLNVRFASTTTARFSPTLSLTWADLPECLLSSSLPPAHRPLSLSEMQTETHFKHFRSHIDHSSKERNLRHGRVTLGKPLGSHEIPALTTERTLQM